MQTTEVFRTRLCKMIGIEVLLFVLTAMSFSYAIAANSISFFRNIVEALAQIPAIGSLFMLFQFWYLTLIPFLIANAAGLIGYATTKKGYFYCAAFTAACLIIASALSIIIHARATSNLAFGPESATLLLMLSGIPLALGMITSLIWGIVLYSRERKPQVKAVSI